MPRRTLLRATAAAPLAVGAPRLWAAPAADARLLVVFLRGGYDAASLLVPASSPFLAEARPTIAVAPPGAGADGALPLDADWALHPALRDSLHRLWLDGRVAFVPFAGTRDLSRSHFETQDGIERGLPDGRGGDRRSGFLNRLAAAVGGAAPIAFADRLPVAFRGELPVPNLAVRTAVQPAVDARQRAVARAPRNATYRVPLGAALCGAGRAGEAVHALESANALDPRSPAAWGNLGNAYQRGGDPARAIEARETGAERHQPLAAGFGAVAGLQRVEVGEVLCGGWRW
ncbi:MAG TPA: hypothetical protein PKC20_07690 [Burkholderiaceae bacterium]|nr:hypothetical protein [Burkholderiaceae bacterium]